tara:strand:+ start:799 stop:1344 length:546 start_codon:yes stop_codon:yes gene_type:complete
MAEQVEMEEYWESETDTEGSDGENPQEPDTPNVSDNGDTIEKRKGDPPPPASINPKTGKPKRVVSQAVLDNLAKARATRAANQAKRQPKIDETNAMKKKKRDAAIIAKATRLKKQQIIEDAMLAISDEDSDDEEDVLKVKAILKKKKQQKASKGASVKESQVKVKTRFAPATAAPPQFVFY